MSIYSDFNRIWNAESDFLPLSDGDETEICPDAQRFGAWARQLLDQTKQTPSEHAFDLAARLLADSFFERRTMSRNHGSLTGDGLRHVCVAHVFEAAYKELTCLRIAFQHDIQPPPIHHPTEYIQLAGIMLGQLDEPPPRRGPIT